MIELKNVSKEFSLERHNNSIKDLFRFNRNKSNNSAMGPSSFYALKDISFRIESGTTVGVLGRNGAGKSTLLKLITAIILPSSGELKITGRVTSLLEASAGFHPDLSGYENIFLAGAILGMREQEVLDKVPQIIDFAEIGDFLHEPVKHYSSGMLVRLAFSIGVNLDNDILVIDEALAVGDSVFRQKCFAKINEIKASGRTILFVSHDIDQVRNVCDRCIVLSRGELVYDGEVDTAIDCYHNLIKG